MSHATRSLCSLSASFVARVWWITGSSNSSAQGVIRTFSANAKFSSPSTAAHLSFMATCIVELFGLNEEAAYAHAFTVRTQTMEFCTAPVDF